MKALWEAFNNPPMGLVWASWYVIASTGVLQLTLWTLKGVLTIVGWFR